MIARAGFTARLTGVVEAMAEPTLPFFLARTRARRIPARAPPPAGWRGWRSPATPQRLREWLGGVGLPVRVQPGEPALLAVGVGERELR